MYDIRIEPAHDLVSVTLGGMMSADEVVRYMTDLRRAVAERLRGPYAIVIDVSACPIQSQEMMAAMGRHMAAMPRARAIALVTGKSLARMQLRRLFTQPYARFAVTAADGRAWALSGIEPPAAG